MVNGTPLRGGRKTIGSGACAETTSKPSDNFYTSAVFNETVQIVEDESSFSTETGFLYVVFAAIAIVLLFIAQHYLSKVSF